MTPDQALAIVSPVYDALTEPAKKDIAALLTQTTAVDFVSCSTETESIGRDEVIARFKDIGKTIPDLSWSIRQLWVSGDDIIVRAEATGTPARRFLEVEPTGRSFKTMSIDIYHIEGGRIARSYHVENWTAAKRQLMGG
ncbi:MAG: ester cyclase [Proteobacteria bacterium]|nr:ester cyclase [Pseudomonadota bacterium]